MLELSISSSSGEVGVACADHPATLARLPCWSKPLSAFELSLGLRAGTLGGEREEWRVGGYRRERLGGKEGGQARGASTGERAGRAAEADGADRQPARVCTTTRRAPVRLCLLCSRHALDGRKLGSDQVVWLRAVSLAGRPPAVLPFLRNRSCGGDSVHLISAWAARASHQSVSPSDLKAKVGWRPALARRSFCGSEPSPRAGVGVEGCGAELEPGVLQAGGSWLGPGRGARAGRVKAHPEIREFASGPIDTPRSHQHSNQRAILVPLSIHPP